MCSVAALLRMYHYTSAHPVHQRLAALHLCYAKPGGALRGPCLLQIILDLSVSNEKLEVRAVQQGQFAVSLCESISCPALVCSTPVGRSNVMPYISALPAAASLLPLPPVMSADRLAVAECRLMSASSCYSEGKLAAQAAHAGPKASGAACGMQHFHNRGAADVSRGGADAGGKRDLVCYTSPA